MKEPDAKFVSGFTALMTEAEEGASEIEPSYHIECLKLLKEGMKQDVVQRYQGKGFVVEALVLCKAFNLETLFKECLNK